MHELIYYLRKPIRAQYLPAATAAGSLSHLSRTAALDGRPPRLSRLPGTTTPPGGRQITRWVNDVNKNSTKPSVEYRHSHADLPLRESNGHICYWRFPRRNVYQRTSWSAFRRRWKCTNKAIASDAKTLGNGASRFFVGTAAQTVTIRSSFAASTPTANGAYWARTSQISTSMHPLEPALDCSYQQ